MEDRNAAERSASPLSEVALKLRVERLDKRAH